MPEPTSEQLKFAGDVNIDKVQLTNSRGLSQNITNQVIGIEYYEDLFEHFITGQLAIRESLDLPNVFQFMGEEFVELEFSTPTLDKPIKNTFYIYKMTDRVNTGDTNVVYNLHFTSVEALVSLNKKISKVFKGKVSDNVELLLKDKTIGLETTKPCNVEPTGNSITWQSPFWTPLTNLSWCAEKATNIAGIPNYLFYENNNGLNFVSLDSLYTNPVKQTFTKDKFTRDFNNDGSSQANPEEEYKRILDLNIPESHDYLDNLRSGMLASRIISFDITRKQYTARNYDSMNNFNRGNHLNPNPSNSMSGIFRPSASLIYRPRQVANFAGTDDNTNFSTLQDRVARMKAANRTRIEITVPGRTDYCVGQKVAVELKLNQPIRPSEDDTEIMDRMYSGFYIISAINHSVNRERHECHMELIKDSLQANPNAVGTR